jgi:hypothetical protein
MRNDTHAKTTTLNRKLVARTPETNEKPPRPTRSELGLAEKAPGVSQGA